MLWNGFLRSQMQTHTGAPRTKTLYWVYKKEGETLSPPKGGETQTSNQGMWLFSAGDKTIYCWCSGAVASNNLLVVDEPQLRPCAESGHICILKKQTNILTWITASLLTVPIRQSLCNSPKRPPSILVNFLVMWAELWMSYCFKFVFTYVEEYSGYFWSF